MSRDNCIVCWVPGYTKLTSSHERMNMNDSNKNMSCVVYVSGDDNKTKPCFCLLRFNIKTIYSTTHKTTFYRQIIKLAYGSSKYNSRTELSFNSHLHITTLFCVHQRHYQKHERMKITLLKSFLNSFTCSICLCIVMYNRKYSISAV